MLTGKPKSKDMVIPWEYLLILSKNRRDNMIGIYKITNELNGKSYVGQSVNIPRRFQEHCQKGESSRIPLDAAISKYGQENFSLTIFCV